MSADEPTAQKDGSAAPSTTDFWGEKEALMSGPPDDAAEPAQVEPQGNEARRGRRPLSRRARVFAAAVLAVPSVALAWIVVPALVGGGSTPPSRSAAEEPPPQQGRPGSGRSAARWAREPGRSAGSRRRHGRSATRQPSHRPFPRRETRRPPSPRSAEPSRSPAPAPPPSEPAPEPTAPALPPESEEEGGFHLRDGATESAEFGL